MRGAFLWAIGRVNQIIISLFENIRYSLILYARAIAKEFAILGKCNWSAGLAASNIETLVDIYCADR